MTRSRDIIAYRFAGFELDLQRETLVLDEREVPLRPKAFTVLRHLVEREGQLVTREELTDEGWKGVVVTEASLTQCLGEIRRALGDEDHTLIRTVPKRGYLFQAPVEIVEAPGMEPDHKPAGISKAATPSPRRPERGVYILGLVLAAALLTWLAFWNSGNGTTPETSRSVTIVPLLTPSDGPAERRFAASLFQELAGEVAGYQELRLVSHGVEAATDAVYRVQGSVDNYGEPRIRVRLDRHPEGVAVWSDTYLQAVDGPGASDLARVIARTVRHELNKDDYCQGIHRQAEVVAAADYACAAFEENLKINLGEGSIDQERQWVNVQKALELDPSLADAYWIGAIHYFMNPEELPRDESFRKTREMSDRALALAPNNPLALFQRGLHVALLIDRDPAAARALFHRAIELDPLHPFVRWSHGALGRTAFFQNDLPEAREHFRRAVSLYDADGRIWTEYATVLMLSGDWETALQASLSGLELVVPDGWMGSALTWARVRSLLELGRTDSAGAVLDRYVAAYPDQEIHFVIELVALGRRAEAERIIAAAPRDVLHPNIQGAFSLAMGDMDAAFEALDRSIGSSTMPSILAYLEHHPYFRPMRNDPRWATAVAQARAIWKEFLPADRLSMNELPYE